MTAKDYADDAGDGRAAATQSTAQPGLNSAGRDKVRQG